MQIHSSNLEVNIHKINPKQSQFNLDLSVLHRMNEFSTMTILIFNLIS